MIKLFRLYHIIVPFSCLIFCYSCTEEEEKPAYLWPEEQFVEVMTEVQMAESMLRLGMHRRQDTLILRDSIYNATFRKMEVKRVDFDSNYNYYLNRPGEFEKLYDQVLIRLSKRSAKLIEKKEEAEQEAKTD